jgi:hypothetical protein
MCAQRIRENIMPAVRATRLSRLFLTGRSLSHHHPRQDLAAAKTLLANLQAKPPKVLRKHQLSKSAEAVKVLQRKLAAAAKQLTKM